MPLKEVDLSEQFSLNIDTHRLDRKVQECIARSQKQKKAAGKMTKKKRDYIKDRTEDLKSRFGL